MIDKIKKIIKENKISIISCLVLLVLGSLIITIVMTNSNKDIIKEYQNTEYILKYDRTWKLKEKEENSIRLTHKNNGEINIKIVPLEGQDIYSTSEELIDELLYDIGKQNDSYKLLTKEKDIVTKLEYEGYKALYETKDKQALLVIAKKTDKLLIVTYEASIETFDILLDSVQNIIYEFEMLEGKFKLNTTLNVKTSPIKWENNENSSDYSKTKQYTTISNNYIVEYTIPSVIKQNIISSDTGYFNNDDYTITSVVSTQNIYHSTIETGDFFTIFSTFNYYKEDESGNYTNLEDGFEKLSDRDTVAYVYKYSYTDASFNNKTYESAIIVFELDKNHTFKITINSKANKKIPKELIDNIKIINFEQYADYIENKIVEDKLIGELRYFADNKYEDYRSITLKLPTKYKEIDKNMDFYSNRYYGLGLNEQTSVYNYEINYKKIKKEEPYVQIAYEMYEYKTDYKPLTKLNDITLNGKTWQVYSGGYSEFGDQKLSNYLIKNCYVNVLYLVTQMAEEEYLLIEIRGNGNEITNEILNDVTIFEVETKKN